jgi:hypothetical protein
MATACGSRPTAAARPSRCAWRHRRPRDLPGAWGGVEAFLAELVLKQPVRLVDRPAGRRTTATAARWARCSWVDVEVNRRLVEEGQAWSSRATSRLTDDPSRRRPRRPWCGVPRMARRDGEYGLGPPAFPRRPQPVPPSRCSDSSVRATTNAASSSTPRRAARTSQRRCLRAAPQPRSRGHTQRDKRAQDPSGGSQSSTLRPSGSMTQPNLPYSDSSVLSSTWQPSARSAASSACRSATR